jgi:hypothetical protein
MSCVTVVRAAVHVTNEMLVIPDEKSNIILMFVVPLMVPILRSNEHIRNFVRPSV